MAKDVPLGMEFMNWQNVPSLSESFAKMASGGQFNPAAFAIGYGLDKAFGGENDYLSNLVGKQQQAFNSSFGAPVAPNTVQPVPPVQANAAPQQPAVPGVPSAAPESPIDKYIPSYSGIRSKISSFFGDK